MNKIIKILFVVFLTGGMLAGCHTVQGAGEDISSGGHVITHAAS
jgi:predicted small secreted protein